MNPQFVLNFAPTGMVPTKQMNPNTPIAINEIIDEVLAAAELGVSIVHLHAREEDGKPTLSQERYGRILCGIRKHNPEIIACVSLSGRNVSDPAQRALPLLMAGDAKPDMGSLTLSSLNFIGQASVNAPATIELLAATMRDQHIAPELEVFDLGMANCIHALQKKTLLPPQIYVNLMLGNIFGAQASFSNIAAMLANMPPYALCSFAGLGAFQLQSVTMALAAGFGVRIGLEDNIWYDRQRCVAASNLTLIKRVLRLAAELELQPASAASVRQRLGLASGYGNYGLQRQEKEAM
jgi:3-keto-5-aminohexanoate cleavage enzyme